MNAKSLLTLARISNLPTIWTNVMAGAAISGLSPNGLTWASLLVSFSCFYTGGMFLNDAYDADWDSKHRPDRPIPSGRISRGTVMAIGFGLLIVGEALLILSAFLSHGSMVAAVVSGAFLFALIVLYNVKHKDNPKAPWIMGMTRGLVYLATAFSLSGAFSLSAIWIVLIALVFVNAITMVARGDHLKEHSSSRALLFMLAPLAAVVPAVLEGLAGFVMGMKYSVAPVFWFGLADIFIGISLVVWMVICYRWAFAEKHRNLPRATVGLIAGISLFDACIMAYYEQPVWALAAFCAFLLTLAFQKVVSGA